jgi:predicted metalloprotease
MSARRPALRLAALLVGCVVLLTSCTVAVKAAGKSGVPPVAPDASLTVLGDAHTTFDRLAKNALTDVFAFWQQAYPSVSGGKALPPLTGGIYSVDDKNITAQDLENGCLSEEPKAIVDNAFYCEVDDSIAYDRVGFIPQLVAKYGQFFVALLFGHEFGHAIQDRLGTVDDLPSIVKETQADCAAGAFTAWVLDLKAPHWRVTTAELEQVLIGYIQLRDPNPHSPSDEGTHGDGFDRLSALDTGITKGVTACYASDWADRPFTERPFISGTDYTNNGNEPEAEVLNSGTQDQGGGGLQPDLNAFWKQAASSIGKSWTDVKIAEAAHPPCEANATSEFGYCAADDTVYYSKNVADKAYAYGDYALGTLFVYGWGLAVRHQLFGRDLANADALVAAGCYAGAYSKSINVVTPSDPDRTFTLSPTDMDEATSAVLTMVGDPLAYGARGTTALDRIDSFVKGYFGGLQVC